VDLTLKVVAQVLPWKVSAARFPVNRPNDI